MSRNSSRIHLNCKSFAIPYRPSGTIFTTITGNKPLHRLTNRDTALPIGSTRGPGAAPNEQYLHFVKIYNDILTPTLHTPNQIGIENFVILFSMNTKTIILLVIVLVAGAVYWFTSQSTTDSTTLTHTDSETTSDNVLADSILSEIESEMAVYHEETAGYLAKPVGDGPFPAVILIHEWWGLNENIKDLADDFAEQGYVALAVDLYDGENADTSEQAGTLAGAVREDTDSAFANLASARSYLDTLPEVDGERLASVGWCFGGQWAYNMAANNMGVDASVMYYGRFSMEDDLSMMRADILGHFGEEDRSIAVDDVKQFEAKLKTLEGEHAVFIYPNAGHAFANEDNEEAYNEEAAQLAWQRTLDFLSRELQ